MQLNNFKEMDETSVNLHYAMLEYLYDEQTLAASCFSHVWEKFRAQSREIQISADELKEIFWREIIPNIAEYELLTDEMLDYFRHENLFLDVHDDNFLRTLKCNEPKAGNDFVVYKASDVDEAGGRIADDEEPLSTIAKKTYLGDFGWDMELEEDTDGACIKVKVGQRAPEIEPEEDDSLDKVLSIVLAGQLQLNAAEQHKKLLMHEMIEILEDENELKEPEDLKTLPRGLQKLMTNCKYFATSLNAGHVSQTAVTPRRTKRSTMLNVPALTSSSDDSTTSDPQQSGRTAITPHTRNRATMDVPDISTSSVAFEPHHASSPMEPSSSQNMSPLIDLSNTPGRQGLRSAIGTRSKPDSAHNTRMGLWMQTMAKNKKRPRSSTPPESK